MYEDRHLRPCDNEIGAARKPATVEAVSVTKSVYKTPNGQSRECGVSNDEHVTLRCPVPASGQAVLFSNEERYGTYGQVVSIAVTQR